jgi:hypothetical protein
MIIPSSSFGVVASSRPRVVVGGGGGADVTPNAVNWTTISFNNDIGEYYYTERQITGINQTITLKVQYTSPGSTVYYFVSNTTGSVIAGGDGGSLDSPIAYSMSSIANNGTFTVSNNQYVTFGVIPVCGTFTTVTVLNQSDGDTTLDTIEMEFLGEC